MRLTARVIERPKPQHNYPPANKDKKTSEEKSTNRHVYIEPGVKIDLVEDLRQEQKTNQEKQTAQQNRQLFWTKVAAGLLLLYTGFTAWQAMLTNTAVNDSRKEQRPYIWSNEKLGVPFQAGQKLEAHIRFENYGKSPAMHIKGRGEIFFGPNALHDADEWFKELGNERFINNETGSETIEPPNVPLDQGRYTSISSDRPPLLMRLSTFGLMMML